MALTTLGLSGAPVHEPVHAVSTAVITESNRAWKPGERTAVVPRVAPYRPGEF